MTFLNNRGRVAIQGETLGEFNINKGLRQGDALSTVLFNIVLERAVRKIEINPGGTIYNRGSQVLAYADDLVLISRSVQELQEHFLQLEQEAKKVGLSVNTVKTKYMIATRNDNRWGNSNTVQIGDHNFERVYKFKYLGSIVSVDNKISDEISERLKDGNRSYGALLPLMKSKDLSKNEKKKIYRTIIRPIVTYASETWTLLKNDVRRLAVWERKILRRIYGPKIENGEWRIRTNEEVLELYGQPDIIQEIKSARLRWLGHIERSDERSLLSKLYKGHPGGRRCIGRPRKRWLEDIEEDIREMGIRTWRRRAQDRGEWATIVRQALVLQGS